MTLISTLTTLGNDNGWTVVPYEASGYLKPKDRTVVRKPFVKRLEFFRGAESIRMDFTPAGSVERVRTRQGFSGTVHNYEWQPGGVRQRATIAREAVTTGIAPEHVMNHHND